MNLVSLHLGPFFVVWVVLALVVLFLLAWRKAVSIHEDESLHLADTNAVAEQITISHKLEQIDKWGKILTVVALVYGLVVGCIYMYQSWVELSSTGLH